VALYVKGNEARIIFVSRIEQLRVLITQVATGTHAFTTGSQREKRTLLSIPCVAADAKVLPVEGKPPVAFAYGSVCVRRGLLRAEVFYLEVAETVFSFREPALIMRQRKKPRL
jgi:hypothetical protein